MGRERLIQLRDEITSKVMGHWWCHHRAGTEAAVPHLNAAMGAVFRVEGRVAPGLLPRSLLAGGEYLADLQSACTASDTPRTASQYAQQLLRSREWRGAAARAVGHLRAAVTPDILEALALLLGDTDANARIEAVNAVRQLGPVAATPTFVDSVKRLLEDGWLAAVEVVGLLGPRAATGDILEALARLLNEENGAVSWRAARAVGMLGPSGITPDILDALARLLRGRDIFVQEAAARAIEGLGSGAGTDGILEALASLFLPRSSWPVVAAAARAVVALGSRATQTFLGAVARRVRHGDPLVRYAEAVRRLGTATAPHAVVEALAKVGLGTGALSVRVPGDYWNVSAWVNAQVGDAGPAAAMSGILASLARLLRHKHWRQAATYVVELLGPVGLTTEILDALAHSLRLGEFGAARAVGSLGPGAARADILDALALKLTTPFPDGDWWETMFASLVRFMILKLTPFPDGGWWKLEAALEAVEGLGPAASPQAIVDALAPLLGHSHRGVRTAAMRAAARFGSAVVVPCKLVSPAVLYAIAHSLIDKYVDVRWAAAALAGCFEREGVRLFLGSRWLFWTTFTGRHVQDLARLPSPAGPRNTDESAR